MKKHIYIYSPSSAIQDKTAFKRGLKRLEVLGYEVEVDECALARHQRFSGNDETRLLAIHRAACSGADIAMIARGGYGLTRILAGIDYKGVAKAIEKGTQFVGFSDFTAFQMALMAKTGALTWAGPALCDDFGAKPEVDDIMEACFNDLLTGQGEGAGWKLPKTSLNKTAINISTVSDNPIHEMYEINDCMLWGGNLTMLCSLIGTPFFPVIQNGILFIEDVGEHPYRVERMLAQLLQAGVLMRQKAIIFGQFSNYKLANHDKGYNLASVVTWLRTQVTAKVLTGLPFGHVATKIVLPVGSPVTLAVDGREAFLLWGHRH